jgi:hypothetical protein
MEGNGPTVFAHACKMGLEGIVSKRKESLYRSGPLAGLAQDEEPGGSGGEAGGRGRMGNKKMAVTDRNRIMICGPQDAAH